MKHHQLFFTQGYSTAFEDFFLHLYSYLVISCVPQLSQFAALLHALDHEEEEKQKTSTPIKQHTQTHTILQKASIPHSTSTFMCGNLISSSEGVTICGFESRNILATEQKKSKDSCKYSAMFYVDYVWWRLNSQLPQIATISFGF